MVKKNGPEKPYDEVSMDPCWGITVVENWGQ